MTELNDNIADASSAPRDAQDEGHVSHEQSASAQFEVGSYVTFGRYPQNNGDTPEPIEWLVLDNDGKTAMLLSKFGLDCRPFHHEDAEISWSDCDLRRWLNSDFFNRAFSADEQGRIFESPVYTEDNPFNRARGCGLTRDKVFCLSVEEFYKYIGNVKEYDCFTESIYSDILDSSLWVRRGSACKLTDYAVSRGASLGKFFLKDRIEGKPGEWCFDNCWFWLRSPGWYNNLVAGVTSWGFVNHRGKSMNLADRAVRPALRIKLCDGFYDMAGGRPASGEHGIFEKRDLASAHKYEFPPLSLLHDSSGRADTLTEDKSEALLEVFRRFNYKATLRNVLHGPAVTRYEIFLCHPGSNDGLTALQDEIAQALDIPARKLRVMPDFCSSATGIEVPRKSPELVALKDILACESFRYGLGLRIALGKDIAGEAVTADLSRLPHLFIAGSAGSGKSVCIHAIILSLLYKFAPDQLQLLIIGSKRRGLSVYEGIPHLIGGACGEAGQVITDPQKAEAALRQAVQLMFSRYRLFAANNAHNIDEYNARSKDRLSRVVVIIEELADLMETAPESVEKSICLLAQKPSVAGIHIVASTQSPSANVITDCMKKKIPSRIAFAVSSQADSRAILNDSPVLLNNYGAEFLLGKGDMLSKSVVSSRGTVRIQGAFVDNEEIGRVAKFWRGQDNPVNKIVLDINVPVPEAPAKQDVAPLYALSAQARFEKGSYVTFGRYPQNNGDTPEPIEWLVLDNDGGTALLISRHGLDGREFHNVFPDAAGWNSCSLREWLNIDFLRKAFNDDEQQRIVESILHNDDTVFEDWNGIIKVTKGCGETRDRVFCLSIDEAEHYFADNVSRMCAATRYAKKRAEKSVRARLKQKKGLITEPSLSVATANSYGLYIQVPVDIDSCCYWLRSPGDCEDSIARVYYDGSIHVAGSDIFEDTEAVRPALRIKL